MHVKASNMMLRAGLVLAAEQDQVTCSALDI